MVKSISVAPWGEVNDVHVHNTRFMPAAAAIGLLRHVACIHEHVSSLVACCSSSYFNPDVDTRRASFIFTIHSVLKIPKM